MTALLLCLLLSDAPPAFPATGEVVLAAGDVPWAAAMRERGSLVPLGGDRLRLYFTGYDGSREGVKRMGLAESDDGGRTWAVRPRPVSPEGVWVEDPFVLALPDGGFEAVAEGRGPDARRLTSDDGLAWTDRGPLDIRGVDGRPISEGPRGTPVLFVHEGTPHLFYERYDAGVWLAASPDFSTWTNISDDPVLVPGPGGWDGAMIALNQVVRRGGRFVAYYHGTDRRAKPRQWAVGAAFSDDLRTWTKFGANPITEPALNESSGMVVDLPGGPVLFTTHAAVRRRAAVQNESP